MRDPNFLLLTYDSCRYDAMMHADTPVLDAYVDIVKAQAPASFTYPAHMAYFQGMLPLADEPYAYYNRFTQQLIGVFMMLKKGRRITAKHVPSQVNMVAGFADAGYQTVGVGAMDWFKQAPLREGFQHFAFTGTDADAQIEYVIENLDMERPFFGFINFGETHHPWTWRGKETAIPEADEVQASRMTWPPQERGKVGVEHPAFAEQVKAIEYLDSRLPMLFSQLPPETVVVLCGDHGECFGEDGYFGHAVNHPKVFEVPMAVFRLDGVAA